jgi:hypothetical protein
MFALELYESIYITPDSYWILYDLCLEQGWAFPDYTVYFDWLGTRACDSLIGGEYRATELLFINNLFSRISSIGSQISSRCKDGARSYVVF